jgi:calcium-dependent protein kinase
MFVMLFGYPPFYADQDDKILALVKKGFHPITKKGYGPHFPADIPCSDSAKDLITKLLTLDVARRLSADEALDHPWLSGKTALDTPIIPSVLDNLRRFEGGSRFKTAVLTAMADSLSDGEIKELEKTFRAIDENGDGMITFAEMKKALEGHKDLKIAPEELKKIVAMADINGDGVLSYEELKLTSVHRKLIAKEERIWLAFCKLDLNGDGRISRDEIKQVLAKQDADVLEMLKEADADGDGTIDYDEFMAVWTKNAAKQLVPPKVAEEEAPAAAAAPAPAAAAAKAS